MPVSTDRENRHRHSAISGGPQPALHAPVAGFRSASSTCASFPLSPSGRAAMAAHRHSARAHAPAARLCGTRPTWNLMTPRTWPLMHTEAASRSMPGSASKQQTAPGWSACCDTAPGPRTGTCGCQLAGTQLEGRYDCNGSKSVNFDSLLQARATLRSKMHLPLRDRSVTRIGSTRRRAAYDDRLHKQYQRRR